MSYGLRKSLSDTKTILKQQRKLHGDTHYVFIAPFDLEACGEMKAFETNIMDERPVPDILLSGRNDLDIYFIEHKYRMSMKEGDPIFFSRMSMSGGPEK